jgi:hypothetical protein
LLQLCKEDATKVRSATRGVAHGAADFTHQLHAPVGKKSAVNALFAHHSGRWSLRPARYIEIWFSSTFLLTPVVSQDRRRLIEQFRPYLRRKTVIFLSKSHPKNGGFAPQVWMQIGNFVRRGDSQSKIDEISSNTNHSHSCKL